MNLLLPDSGLIIWMTIIFAIVFFVLAKFGFPMITGMVEKRRVRIEESIEAARKAEEAIANLDAEMEQSSSDYVKLQELCLKKEEQEEQLMELYDKWETVSAQLEEARG